MNYRGQRSLKNTSISLYNIYVDQLRVHTLSLLWLAYKRLTPSDFAFSEEDEITGELTKEMKAVLQSPHSPPWVEHYSVSEQIPANIKKKRGKRRPKIDVEIERNKRGKRPRLPFEAKRLGRGSNVGDYLGSEGLGAFLDGTYPTTHNEAGMLGYVQDHTEANWAKKISEKTLKRPKQFKITPNGQWTFFLCNQPPSNTFQTSHFIKAKKRLKMIHVFFLFH